MPKTIETIVYTYDELPTEKAKEAARDWWIEGNYDWYNSVYEDAEQAGIKIKGFDLGCGQDIKLACVVSDTETAEYILANHGETCDTFKAAKAWENAIDALPEMPADFDCHNQAHVELEAELCAARDAIESKFIADLEKAYFKMLRDEYEYSQSEEAVSETLMANEYTFTETGKRFG